MPASTVEKNKTVTGKELAEWLVISRTWLYQLVADGVIKKDENNRFNLKDSISRYCQHLRTGQVEKKTDTQAQYWQEKAQHEASRREMAAINLGKIKGELLEAKDVEMALGGMLTVFRRRMLALPHKMAKILVGKKEREIGRLLSREIDSALTDLSDCDVSKFGDGGDTVNDGESN